MRIHAALLALHAIATAAHPQLSSHNHPPDNDVHTPSRLRALSAHISRLMTVFDKPKQVHFSPQDSAERTFARYGNDVVLRFNISTAEESASLADAANTLLLDVWEFTNNWVDVRLATDDVPYLLGLLPDSLHRAHRPLLREKELAQAIHENYARSSPKSVSDVPPTLPARRPFSLALDAPASDDAANSATGRAETNIFFADYQPFTVIEPWMRLMASLFTTHVRHVNLGLSYQGRVIPGLRIGVHPTISDDPNPPKRKTVLITGSLHAREWISTTTVNYIAYSLITGYGKLPAITRLLERFDFILVPTLNPDGYVYTWETDRLWRKNRQRTELRFCQGIDLDRSFGFEWSATGNPCSESFSGKEPFEAAESKSFSDWAKNQTENNNVEFIGFLDLHSYSQQVLYPYSYSCENTPPGLENLEELAMGLAKAIRITHGHNYEVMPACEGNVGFSSFKTKTHLRPRMEESGGSALDFFYHTMGVRYSYQLKLRDRGTYGFLLPKEDIIPTGKEILNAVLYFGEFLSDLYDADAVDMESKSTEEENKDEEQKPRGRGSVADTPNMDAAAGGLAFEVSGNDEDDWVVVEDVPDSKWDLRRRRRR